MNDHRTGRKGWPFVIPPFHFQMGSTYGREDERHLNGSPACQPVTESESQQQAEGGDERKVQQEISVVFHRW